VDRPERPPVETPGGWGLWLAGELTDTMRVESCADGTAVRIATRVA
jgi:hypothetical protein